MLPTANICELFMNKHNRVVFIPLGAKLYEADPPNMDAGGSVFFRDLGSISHGVHILNDTCTVWNYCTCYCG